MELWMYVLVIFGFLIYDAIKKAQKNAQRKSRPSNPNVGTNNDLPDHDAGKSLEDYFNEVMEKKREKEMEKIEERKEQEQQYEYRKDEHIPEAEYHYSEAKLIERERAAEEQGEQLQHHIHPELAEESPEEKDAYDNIRLHLYDEIKQGGAELDYDKLDDAYEEKKNKDKSFLRKTFANRKTARRAFMIREVLDRKEY